MQNDAPQALAEKEALKMGEGKERGCPFHCQLLRLVQGREHRPKMNLAHLGVT